MLSPESRLRLSPFLSRAQAPWSRGYPTGVRPYREGRGCCFPPKFRSILVRKVYTRMGPSIPARALERQSSLVEGLQILGQEPDLTFSPRPLSQVEWLGSSGPHLCTPCHEAHLCCGASVEVGLGGKEPCGLMLTALHRVGISTPI